jgi:hypothetical protein
VEGSSRPVEVLSQYLPEGMKSHVKPSTNGICGDLNPGLPKYEAEVRNSKGHMSVR